jgi:3-oxoacyl-[acyl-carrier protein] reductase
MTETRTAIITGGAGALGLAIASRLHRSGHRVALTDHNAAALKAASAALADCPFRIVDQADARAVRTALDELAGELGRISALINCAAIVGPNVPVEELPDEDWLRVIQVNLTGLFYCCKYAIPHLKKAGAGRIVNVASIAGKEGNPTLSAYSASKAGVIGLTKSLGKELACTDVTVNCITPAAVRSPILQSLSPQQLAYVQSKIPMGRIGEPEEVAAMVAWMASEECSFTTGAVFDLSGGRATY